MAIDFQGVLSTISQGLKSAAAEISEKNKNAAKVGRLQSEIKRQRAAAEREYITLGRYYYSTLRDASNGVTEPHSAALDIINQKMEALINELDDHYEEVANLKAERAAERISKKTSLYMGEREDVDIEDVDVYQTRPLIELKSKEEILDDLNSLKARVGENAEKAYISGKEAVMKATGKAVEKSGEIVLEIDKKKDDLIQRAADKVWAAKAKIKNMSGESEEAPEDVAADADENDNLPFE